MNPPLSWYLRLPLGIRSLADAVAVPKIAASYLREELARFLLDRTPVGAAVLDVRLGHAVDRPLFAGAALLCRFAPRVADAIHVVDRLRWHLRRAEELGAAVYCVWHACDTKDCPADGAHD